jgi:hypothetical protein
MPQRKSDLRKRVEMLLAKYPSRAICVHDVVSMLDLDGDEPGMRGVFADIVNEGAARIVNPESCERVASPYRHVKATEGLRATVNVDRSDIDSEKDGDDLMTDKKEELQCTSPGCPYRTTSQKRMKRHMATRHGIGDTPAKKRKYAKRGSAPGKAAKGRPIESVLDEIEADLAYVRGRFRALKEGL